MPVETTQRLTRAKRARARHCAYYLALVQRESKNWQRIELCYAQIKRAFDTVPDWESRIGLLENVSFFQLRRGRWNDCVQWSNTCLAWAERTGREDIAARLYRCQGEAFIQIRQFDRAIDALQTALSLARRVDDQDEANRALAAIAQTYARQYRWDETLCALNELLDGPGSTVNDVTAKALVLRSTIHLSKHQWENVEQDYLLAYKLAETYDDSLNMFYAQMRLGNFCEMQGKWREAENHYRRGLAIIRSSGDRFLEASVLQFLGTALRRQERFDHALVALHQSLRLTREVFEGYPEPYGEIGILTDIGVCLYRQGRLQDAHQIFSTAYERARKQNDRLEAAWVSTRLADTHRALGQPRKAEALLGAALNVARDLEDYEGMGEILIRLGDLRIDFGDPDKAQAYWNEALGLVHPSSWQAQKLAQRLNPYSESDVMPPP